MDKTCIGIFYTYFVDFFAAGLRLYTRFFPDAFCYAVYFQIAKEIYRAKYADFSDLALQKIRAYSERGYGELCVCIAKTQYSFSDDPTKLGAPEDFTVTVRNVKICAGAGFVVAYAGSIVDMPGLPEFPAAENIDIDDNGKISGLF